MKDAIAAAFLETSRRTDQPQKHKFANIRFDKNVRHIAPGTRERVAAAAKNYSQANSILPVHLSSGTFTARTDSCNCSCECGDGGKPTGPNGGPAGPNGQPTGPNGGSTSPNNPNYRPTICKMIGGDNPDACGPIGRDDLIVTKALLEPISDIVSDLRKLPTNPGEAVPALINDLSTSRKIGEVIRNAPANMERVSDRVDELGGLGKVVIGGPEKWISAGLPLIVPSDEVIDSLERVWDVQAKPLVSSIIKTTLGNLFIPAAGTIGGAITGLLTGAGTGGVRLVLSLACSTRLPPFWVVFRVVSWVALAAPALAHSSAPYPAPCWVA